MRILTSVLMPTMPSREAFARRAVRQIMGQLPEMKVEILVVVSESDPEPQLKGPCRIIRAPDSMSLGERRNVGVRAARGEFIVLWDDDDWSGPRRLARLLEPVLIRRADLTVFRDKWYAYVGGRFWRFGKEFGYVDGSICTRKEVLLAYPFSDANLAETLWSINCAVDAGLRLEIVSANLEFCVVRHGTNTWKFHKDEYLIPATAPYGPMKEAALWPVN